MTDYNNNQEKNPIIMNPAENPDLVEIGVPFREIAAYLGMTIAEVKLHNPDLEHVADDAFLPSGLAIHTGRTPSSSITRQRTSKNNSAPVSNSNSNVNSMNPNSVSTVPTESKLEDVPGKVADDENNKNTNKPEFQPETTTIESVSKHLGISPEELRKENPQLDKLVESNQHPIPVGTALKIPKKSASQSNESKVPNKNMNNNNNEQNEKGQSLRQISEATGVSVSALREQNPQLSHLLAVDDDDTIIPLGTPMKIKKPKTPQQKENDKNDGNNNKNNIDEDVFDFTVTNPNHDKNTNSLKNLSSHMGMPIEEIRRKNPWLKQKRIKDEDELPFGAALNFASDNDEESENEAEFDVGEIKNKSNDHHLIDDPRLHHHQHQPSQVTVSPQIEPNSFEYISRQTGIPVHILRASNVDKIGKDYDSRKAIPEGTKLTVSRNCLPLIRHQADGLNPDKNHHRGHHRHRSHVHHPDLHKNQHENEKPVMPHNNNNNNANNSNDNSKNDNNNNNKHAGLGQSLLEIAQRTGVSTQNLREWNPSISHFTDCDIVPNETALKIKRKKNNNNSNALETPSSTGETERADSSLTPSEQHGAKLNATRSDVHQDDLLSSDDERERNELHHHRDNDLKNNFLSVPKQNSPTPSSSPTTTIRDALAHSRKNAQVAPAESQHQNDEETFLRNLFVQTSLVSAEKDLRSNVKDEEHEKRSDLILNHNRVAANITSRDLRQKQQQQQPHVKIRDDPEVLSSSPTTPRNSPSSPLKQAEKMKQQQQQQREEETLLRTLYASQTLSNAERTHRSKLENDEKAELIDFIMMKGQLRQAEQIRRDAEIQNLHKKQQEIEKTENERRLRQDRERDERQRNEEALNNQKQQQQLRNSFQKQERHRLELDESVHRGEMKMEAKEEFDDLGAEINQRIKILERREILQQHQYQHQNNNRAHNSSNPASNHKNLHHSSTSPYEEGDDDITPRHSTRQLDHAFDTSNVDEEEDPDDLVKIKAHASGKLPEIVIDDPSPIQNKSLVSGFDAASASSGSPLLRPRTSFRNNDSNNREDEDDETPRADFSFAPTPFHNRKNNNNKNAVKTGQIPPLDPSHQESSAFIGKSRRRQNDEEGRTSPTNDELIAEESGVKQAPMKLPPRRPTNMYPPPPSSTSQLAQNGNTENSKNNSHLINFNEQVKRPPPPPPSQAKSKPSNAWASPETLDLTTNTTATTTALNSKTPYSSFNFKHDSNINQNNDYYPERKSPVSPPPVPATLLMNQDGSNTFSQNSTPENFISRQMNNKNNNSNNFNHHENQSGDDDEDAEYEFETLETISYKTGVPVSKLKEFNPSLKNLDAKQILPEGTLIRTQPLRDANETEQQSIKLSSAPSTTKKIHHDDRLTLESISNETGHSVDEIRAANPQIAFFKRDQEIPSHIQLRAPTKPQSNSVENVSWNHDATNRKMSSPAKPSSTILQNVGDDDDSFLHSREKLRAALQKDFDDSRPHVQEKKNRDASNQKTLKNLAAKYNMTPDELRDVDPATLGALAENDEISPIVALRIENAIKTIISQRQQKQDREKEQERERQHQREETTRRERISTDRAKKQEDYAITDSDDEDYYFDRLGKRHLKETNVYGKRDDKNDDEYLDEEGRSELYSWN